MRYRCVPSRQPKAEQAFDDYLNSCNGICKETLSDKLEYIEAVSYTMPFNNQRQVSLLLVLAGLGVALLLYRLSASDSRISKTAPIKHAPATGNTPKRHPYGRHIWNKRVVGVGDLHGGKNESTVTPGF